MWTRDQASQYYAQFPDAYKAWQQSGVGYAQFAEMDKQRTGRSPDRPTNGVAPNQHQPAGPAANPINYLDNIQKWDLNTGPRPDDPYAIYYSQGANDYEVFQKAADQARKAYLAKAQELLGPEEFSTLFSSGRLDETMQQRYGISRAPNRIIGQTDWRNQANRYAEYLNGLKNWQQGSISEENNGMLPGTPPPVPEVATPPAPPLPGTGPGAGTGFGSGSGSFGGASGGSGGGMLSNQSPVRPPVSGVRYPTVADSSNWMAKPTAFTPTQQAQGMLR